MPRNRSAASYSPKVFDALVRASKESFTIPCPDRKTAIALRSRLYSLRKQLEKENHPDHEALKVVHISLVDTSENVKFPFTLQLSPTEDRFDALLDMAGVTPEAKAPEVDFD